ncbi:hypothetical protein P153DRAFT_349026 [Dothidotthia symphoricarpi CBS 119687]|uniref:Uncharacterized protein n=1 Tax=Dothidotthia symphoricarpi CBS 119687 TaxID=1392245 RepID=A0A6A6A194_9PLEO|nr:uncharacterized protein P153DRAFT_349026 [Dothidotthia symphoricarpi CBS 119687]KAF2124934.1 hypothetical protein P153DRAFT_349026 [Dothidotthia symphoricarpi CBS 119687]
MRSILSVASLLLLPLPALCQSITDSDGYTGYKLDIREDGDPLAVVYETENTTLNVSALIPEPDVMLNASVHVGEIYIGVDNLTAKINLDAQVLSLLQFNAGVDLSIEKVSLLIQNVTAKVYLEARLTNLVKMISDVLDSVDLNPVIAELGNGLGSVLDDAGDLITDVAGGDDETTQAKAKREIDLMQFEVKENILYSVNNFSGNTHKRRVLAQNGDIVEQTLNNYGSVSSERVVGNYEKDMRFNGFNESVTFKGEEVREEEYIYEPFKGLFSISGVFKNKVTGEVVGTQILAEARGGGSASIGNVD